MAELFIANCTRQPHDFHYRVPAEDGRAYIRRIQIQRIEPQSQQRIHTDAPLPVLEAIIDQHRAYGLVPVADVVRAKNFVGLCYSFDKPVDLSRLEYAIDHNKGVLVERGDVTRQETAVAVDRAIEQNLEDARRASPELPAASVASVEVETLEDSAQPSFGKGVRVDKQTPGTSPQPVASARRARRRNS